MSGVDLGPILFGADGTNYKILKYDDDDSTHTRNHTKGIIWFTADGNGSININLKFFDKSITHFVILSRCVEGEVNLGFSSNIFNVSSTVGDVPLYFEDINMNNRSIKNLGGPTDDGDVTNKKYVDEQNAKQNIAINDKASKSFVENEDLKIMDYLDNLTYSYAMDSYTHNNANFFIFRDIGSEFFKTETYFLNNDHLKINVTGKCILIYDDMFKGTGDLSIAIGATIDKFDKSFYTNMSYSKWTPRRIKQEFSINTTTYLAMTTEGSLISKGSGADVQKFRLYVISNSTYISYADTRYLKLDGGGPMTGRLKMGNEKITDVGDPTDDNDATNKKYVDDENTAQNTVINSKLDKNKDIPMAGKRIIGLPNPIGNQQPVTLGYGDLRYLRVDGGNSLQSDIRANNKKIIYLGPPTDEKDATNKKYVDDENAKQDTTINNISNVSAYNTNLITTLQTSKADQQYVDDKIKESEERSTRSLYKENVFKKVMDDGLFIEDDDDIHKIGKEYKDFHRVNKQTSFSD